MHRLNLSKTLFQPKNLIDKSNIDKIQSSLIGRTTPVGYYIDWFIEWFAGKAYFTIIATSASFFGGMCFYTTGMVDDLRLQIGEIDQIIKNESHGRFNHNKIFPKVRRSIQFHCEVLE